MRVSRPKTSLLFYFFLLTLFSIPITARADDDEPDDYDVKARVARISLISGEVNLKRNGNQDWEPVRLNYPLVEGDEVATGKGSLLEIQVDARNFVRLTASSVLRIVTLRDEGIALSVLEGTAAVRLAKFDRDHEYFEMDAPKTTMAAEKKGLYRIDVPSDGRVRLTVRDGGSARIYSDTSGFALRDGRSAVLVVNGENAGDWELLAAAPRDAVDEWVNERENYLAQRLKYDVKYFDEYVWGAEDLDAYGDWRYTDDFGWIWQPRATAIASYNDWAPYRYGHWTWCPPYGWTWVGYEPWGWAPYHYGRWVYHNNYWAWCPRSQYYRNRSWWRPALVAFVFNISFGNDVCWYPLSYHQRDPYSRHYRHNDGNRHDDRRPGYGRPRDGRPGDGPNDRHGYDKTWRGVTRVPRTDFGRPNGRGRAADEPIARRVVDAEPQTVDLPRRSGVVRAPGMPVLDIPDRPTGASDRAPGVPLDEDLRRSRVFRGREPRRPAEPTEPRRTEEGSTPAVTQTPPTGAVARPETPAPRETRPNEDRPEGRGRMVRPAMPEGAEKPTRHRERIETTPSTTPEPRNEPPRVEPRSEPRTEAPRSEPPRTEAPRTEPPRTEAPRSEPRESRPEPRSEPRESRPEPRSEPRSEPRESRPEPRSEPPRSEPPRSEPPPRSDPPARSEPPGRSESPKTEAPRSSESPRTTPDRPKPDRPDQ